MTKELEQIKECPFCGSTDGNWSNHDSKCYARLVSELIFDYQSTTYETHGEEAMRNAWNVRHKRTCKMMYEEQDPPIHSGKWTCSNCGAWAMNPPYDWSEYKHCPACGSEVIDD